MLRIVVVVAEVITVSVSLASLHYQNRKVIKRNTGQRKAKNTLKCLPESTEGGNWCFGEASKPLEGRRWEGRNRRLKRWYVLGEREGHDA